MLNLNGVLVVNKPSGFTSFDVIAKLRGVLKTRKIGHSGTLDPMAVGVLPLFIGRSTRLIDIVKDHSKSYIATVKLGLSTDTMDITGSTLYEETTNFKKEDILKAISMHKGTILQVPPMYSSVKVNGQRLYKLAREGKDVKRQARPVEIYDIQLLDFCFKDQTFKIFVECGKGTYIRSLAYDIAKSLGSCACLTSLTRTKSNGFCIEESYTIDEIIDLYNNRGLENLVISPEDLTSDLPKIVLSQEDTYRFMNGIKLQFSKLVFIGNELQDYIRVYNHENVIIAIAYKDAYNFLRVKVFLKVDIYDN